MHYDEHEAFTYLVHHLHIARFFDRYTTPFYHNDFNSCYSSEAICVSTTENDFGLGLRSGTDRFQCTSDVSFRIYPFIDEGYFRLPKSMYSSLFVRVRPLISFPWNWGSRQAYLRNIFSNFLTLHERKNFLCIGAGSGYVNFLAGYLLKEGGVNHGLEMAEELFKECQMRARDLEWNLPALQTRIIFPSFFKTPGRLFNGKVRYDSIFCNRYVTFEDAWWMASFLSDGGVMLCLYVDNDEEEVASMLFSKATTVSIRRITQNVKLLLNESKSNLVLLDLRGKMSSDDLSTLCLQSISESLRQKFRHENPRDIESQCIRIWVDWGWFFYMRYKAWFDEFFYTIRQSITLIHTFLLRVSESDVDECLKAAKSLINTFNHIKNLHGLINGFASVFSYYCRRELVNTDGLAPDKLIPLAFFWCSSLCVVLSSSLKYLKAAAVQKPNIWCELKKELDRLITEEKETSYDIFDMRLRHPELRSLQVSWGLRRAVCSNLYKVMRRYFEFIEKRRCSVSTASPRADVDYLLNFKELLKEFKTGVDKLSYNECLLNIFKRPYTSSAGMADFSNRCNECIDKIMSKVQLWNDCFESAILMSLGKTRRSQMKSMTLKLKLLRDVENGLHCQIEGQSFDFDATSVFLIDSENINIISHIFSLRDNDRVNWSLNIPKLALSWLRQISSLLSVERNVKKNYKHKYHRFLDNNASQLLPPALRKNCLSKLREM